MSTWVGHSGGGCPVDVDALVDIELRDGTILINNTARSWYWENTSEEHLDIVSWRLSGEDVIIPVEDLSETPSSEGPIQIMDKPIVSTGGSSNYYKLSVSNNSGENIECETTDIIYALVGGDFMLGNALKALRRIYQSSKGVGKDGTSMEYDKNKIEYFVTEYVKMCEQTKGA